MKGNQLTIAIGMVVLLAACHPDSSPPATDQNTNSPASSAVENPADSASLAPPATEATVASHPSAIPVDSPSVDLGAPQVREFYLGLAEQRLRELGARIDDLAEKLQPPVIQLQDQADQSLAGLRQQREEAEATLSALLEQQQRVEAKFEKLKVATTEVWADLQADFEVAMLGLQTAFENAKSKFS